MKDKNEEKEPTIIELAPEDCAWVLYHDGREEMYANCDEDEKAPDHVCKMVAAVTAMKIPELAEQIWAKFDEKVEEIEKEEAENGHNEQNQGESGTGENEDRADGESA